MHTNDYSTPEFGKAMIALQGARIVLVLYGDILDSSLPPGSQRVGDCWDLYLEGGGMVSLGAVGVEDSDFADHEGVELVAAHYPHAEVPVVEADVDHLRRRAR